MPAIFVNITFPANCAIANIKNSIVRLMNTNCNARLTFSVPKNVARVKMPHIMKYDAIEAADGATNPVIFGRTKSTTRLHQNKP